MRFPLIREPFKSCASNQEPSGKRSGPVRLNAANEDPAHATRVRGFNLQPNAVGSAQQNAIKLAVLESVLIVRGMQNSYPDRELFTQEPAYDNEKLGQRGIQQ
jgi:hypothetical protein